MQVKLLRAIQEGEIDPVGSRKPVKVSIRLISATNRNMIEMVKAGQFREDLYYRLNVFPIMVPPLRDRKDDIPALVEHFITRFAAEEGRKVRGIDARSLAMLQAYAWPGNVRQLENTIFRAIVLCEGDTLHGPGFPADRRPGRRLRCRNSGRPCCPRETATATRRLGRHRRPPD